MDNFVIHPDTAFIGPGLFKEMYSIKLDCPYFNAQFLIALNLRNLSKGKRKIVVLFIPEDARLKENFLHLI